MRQRYLFTLYNRLSVRYRDTDVWFAALSPLHSYASGEISRAEFVNVVVSMNQFMHNVLECPSDYGPFPPPRVGDWYDEDIPF